jgi:hypothetical protein
MDYDERVQRAHAEAYENLARIADTRVDPVPLDYECPLERWASQMPPKPEPKPVEREPEVLVPDMEDTMKGLQACARAIEELGERVAKLERDDREMRRMFAETLTSFTDLCRVVERDQRQPSGDVAGLQHMAGKLDAIDAQLKGLQRSFAASDRSRNSTGADVILQPVRVN